LAFPISLGNLAKGVWYSRRIDRASLIAAEIAVIAEIAAVGVPV
jgi:hypothetical protein